MSFLRLSSVAGPVVVGILACAGVADASPPLEPQQLAPSVPTTAPGSQIDLAIENVALVPVAAMPVRRTAVAADADNVVTSPAGAYVVAGTAMYTSRGAKGGLAALYATPRGGPTGAPRPVPVTNVDYSRTSFSPDGHYLVVNSHTQLLRDPGSTPQVTVLSVPDLRILGTYSGVDPYWTGPRSIVFRDGRTPYRVDVGSTPVALGPAHSTYGCTTESFGPSTPCRSDLYTTILAIVPDGSGWIVNDTSSSKQIDRMRIMRFDTGQDHITFEQPGSDKNAEVSFVGYALPSKSRTCATYVTTSANGSKQSELRCVRLPSEQREHAFLGAGSIGGSWIGAEQILLFDEAGRPMGEVDLSRKTLTHFIGLDPSDSYPLALDDGGRKLLFRGSGRLADLDAKTIAPVIVLKPQRSISAERVPGDARRFLLRVPNASNLASWESVEL